MSFTDPLIGKTLGDYKIESLLGAGGMARVYQGYDEKLDRYAAVKVIEPNLVASDYDEEYRERFLREARSIARLNHPNVVGVYQFNQVGNLYYIAMAFIEGEDLRHVLKKKANEESLLTMDQLLQIVSDIADALDYIHTQNIVHRDVKPSNIIVTTEGRAVLTDFGLVLNAAEGTIGNTFGSVHYIAPEQAVSSAQAVPQSDLYSLGVVLYEMLTGRVPFDDASAMSVALKHISDPPPPLSEINPNVPPQVERVVIKSLDKEPTRRFATGHELVNALKSAIAESRTGSTKPSLITRHDEPPPSDKVPSVPQRTMEDAPTIRDTSSKSRPMIDKALKDRQSQGSRNRWLFIVGALVIIALIVVGVLASGVLSPSEVTTPDETQLAGTTVVVQAGTEDVSATENTIQTAAAGAEATRVASLLEMTPTEVESTEDPTGVDETGTAAANLSATEVVQTQTETANIIETMEAGTADAIVVLTESAATPTDEPVATDTPVLEAAETSLPEVSETPLLLAEARDEPELMLRYNSDSIVMGNRALGGSIDIRNLTFVLFEPNRDGQPVEKVRYIIRDASSDAFIDRAISLSRRRCLQVWDGLRFSGPPLENPLTNEICAADPFWVTTLDIFWYSASPDAYFEVRSGSSNVLTTCTTSNPQSDAEIRCVVNIP